MFDHIPWCFAVTLVWIQSLVSKFLDVHMLCLVLWIFSNYNFFRLILFQIFLTLIKVYNFSIKLIHSSIPFLITSPFLIHRSYLINLINNQFTYLKSRNCLYALFCHHLNLRIRTLPNYFVRFELWWKCAMINFTFFCSFFVRACYS